MWQNLGSTEVGENHLSCPEQEGEHNTSLPSSLDIVAYVPPGKQRPPGIISMWQNLCNTEVGENHLSRLSCPEQEGEHSCLPSSHSLDRCDWSDATSTPNCRAMKANLRATAKVNAISGPKVK
jgi:hypothetical protein